MWRLVCRPLPSVQRPQLKLKNGASGSDERGLVGLELRITVGSAPSGAGAKRLRHDGGKGGVYGMYMDPCISSVLANEIELPLVVAFC